MYSRPHHCSLYCNAALKGFADPHKSEEILMSFSLSSNTFHYLCVSIQPPLHPLFQLPHIKPHTHTHTHMSTGSTKYNFMYIHGYKLKGRKIRGPRRFDFSPYSISSDVTKTVKIIYCKMPRILFALNVTSAVMMEVSGHLNSQAALPLAVVNPISGG